MIQCTFTNKFKIHDDLIFFDSLEDLDDDSDEVGKAGFVCSANFASNSYGLINNYI